MENKKIHFLFLFIDGLGLGEDNPESNPLSKARIPNLDNLLSGKKLVKESAGTASDPFITDDATLWSIDCTMGVSGYPQSATGQATILTGINIPKLLGYHFGPKPSSEIKHFLEKRTIFQVLPRKGFRAALLNGYPQSYFNLIQTGRRLPGAIAMAVQLAGIPLKNTMDMRMGRALSADLTGLGWRERLNISDIPIYSASDSGKLLARLSQDYNFAFFEYWLSDYAGHRADMDQACQLLETFDKMLGGLIDSSKENIIFITSDHGNLEDLTTRKHTCNPVPGLIIGPKALREKFLKKIETLSDIAPAIYDFFDYV